MQDSQAPQSWEAVAAQLRAYHDQQKRTWGDLDHGLMGRYLAGEVNADERSRVEAALAQHPELRMLTEVVGDVLSDLEPVAAPAESPRILSIADHKPQRKPIIVRTRKMHQRFALAAVAACLLIGFIFALRQGRNDPANQPSPDGGRELVGDTRPSDGRMKDKAPRVDKGGFGGDKRSFAGDKDRAKMGTETKQDIIGVRTFAPKPVFDAQWMRRTIANLAEVAAAEMKTDVTADSKVSFSFKTPEPPPMGINVAASQYQPPPAEDIRGWALQKTLPVLIDGLKQNEDPALRERCAKVLGRMGPLAAPAVPELMVTLKEAKTPQEQTCIADAIGQVGPPARLALPALEQLAETDNKNKDVQVRAREAVRRVRGQHWVGVRDPHGILTKDARDKLNDRIRKLSEAHQVYIVAEAVRDLPEEAKKNVVGLRPMVPQQAYFNQVAQQRFEQVGGDNTVYLFVCMDPPAVQFALGQEAQRKATKKWDADIATKNLEKCVRDKKCHEGLDQVVNLIEEAVAK